MAATVLPFPRRPQPAPPAVTAPVSAETERLEEALLEALEQARAWAREASALEARLRGAGGVA